MKPSKTYLKGKSIFIVSLVVIVLTCLLVYFSGIHQQRSFTANLYLSLSIIASALFLFMTYGLYVGVGLKDDFSKFKKFKISELTGNDNFELPSNSNFSFPSLDLAEGIGGIILSIVLWILMAILMVFLLLLLEAILWFTLVVLITMLYWLFFRALKLVFSKSKQTQGNLATSALYAFMYTALYVGWIFGIVYLVEILQ